MNPIAFAIPIFFLLIAFELWVAHSRGVSVYRLKDSLTSINIGIMSEFSKAIGGVVSVIMYALIADRFGAFVWDVRHPMTWVSALLLYDFCYYWVHRTGHEINILWASHVVHHSSEEFNLSTALRQSSTGFLFRWIFYIPLALLGYPVQVFVVVGLIDFLYQYWVHTQLVGRMGVLERFLVTPSNHRVHHGQNDYCIDRNYGGIFSIWDKMFGTYADERPDEKVVYGVRKPLRSWDPVWANIQHYLVIGRLMSSAPSLREKLAHVFGPPRGPLHLHAVGEQPFQADEFTPFATPYSSLMKLIGGLSTVVGTVMLLLFYIVQPQMTLSQSILYSGVMLAFFSAIGRLWLHPRMMRGSR